MQPFSQEINMLDPRIQIQDTVTPRLRELHNRIAPGRRRPLMRRLGKALEVTLREHFRRRNMDSGSTSKRAAKGFPQQGIWNRIRTTTALAEVSDGRATVNIGEPAMRTKLSGANITPGPGKKFLAIPLRAIVYGKAARGNPVPGMFARWVNGKGYLASAQVPGREGQLTVLYRLLRSAKVPADPQALPPASAISAKLERIAEQEINRARQ